MKKADIVREYVKRFPNTPTLNSNSMKKLKPTNGEQPWGVLIPCPKHGQGLHWVRSIRIDFVARRKTKDEQVAGEWYITAHCLCDKCVEDQPKLQPRVEIFTLTEWEKLRRIQKGGRK